MHSQLAKKKKSSHSLCTLREVVAIFHHTDTLTKHAGCTWPVEWRNRPLVAVQNTRSCWPQTVWWRQAERWLQRHVLILIVDSNASPLPQDEDTILNRLHIDHSYLTNSSILRKEEAPVYVTCDTVITVKHVLIECVDSVEIRKKYFEERSLYSLFGNVIAETIFDFLGETGVLCKISRVVE